ncbi:hypothetical protein D3C86_2164130 [compost metagenome]
MLSEVRQCDSLIRIQRFSTYFRVFDKPFAFDGNEPVCLGNKGNVPLLTGLTDNFENM